MSLVAFALWAIAANFAGLLPSRRNHWPAAYVLIATGLPLLIWVFWTQGPIWGVVCLAAGLSILRWPVRYALRWLSRLGGARQ